jgi:hypothetical protein
MPWPASPARAGELHWTGVKLHGWLKRQLAIELGYRTVLGYLHQLDYHLRVPRTWPERQDEAARKAFLEALDALQQDPRVELWFADESAAWRATRARGAGGWPGAAGPKCPT